MSLTKLDIPVKAKGDKVNHIEVNEVVDGINAVIDTLNGASSVQYNCVLSNNLDSKSITASKDDTTCPLKFTYTSQERYSYSDPYENTGERGLCEISIKNTLNTSFTVVKQVYIQSGEITTLDIMSYLASGANSVMLKVTGEITEQVTPALVYSVTLTTLSINGDNFKWWTPYSSGFPLNLNIGGNVSKILYITVTGKDYTASYQASLGTNIYTETYFNYTIPHPGKTGIFNVTAYVANTDGSLKTKTLSFNIMCILAGATDKLIVINSVVDKYTNWTETILFYYAIYDAGATSSGAIFTMKKDTEVVYTSTEDAIVTATKNAFQFSAEMETTDDADFTTILHILNLDSTVLHDPISFSVGNSLGYSAIAGAVLNVNPRTRANSQSNKKYIVNEVDQSVISATWANMNWSNDGWTTDDSNDKVLRLLSSSLLTLSYTPFATECAKVGKTLEFDYRVNNITDYSNPVIACFATSAASFVGLKVFPNKIIMFTQSLKNDEFQSIPTDDGVRIRVSLVIMPDAYGNSGFNLCIIYINGKKCRTFTYEDNDYFSQAGDIVIGSDTADVDIYGIRMYNSALTSTSVLKNYINWLEDTDLKLSTKAANDVLNTDGSDLLYDNIVDQYNVFVFSNTFPSFTDQASRVGTLEVKYISDPTKNFSITNVTAAGQGTSSKKYLEWNERFSVDKTKSVITYSDGTTGTKAAQMFTGIPKCAKITFKKNWASSMQDHKAGSVNSYTDLWKKLGYTNEAVKLDSTVRVSVYQQPFIGFQKITAEDGTISYKCMGEFTGGPDKGDANCFGYDTTKFPGLISIEGSDNSPLPALFRVPWNTARITLSTAGDEFTYNSSNCFDFDGGTASNIAKFIPAYNLTYQCSNRIKPFNGTLDELNAAVGTYKITGYDYWIVKSGDANRYNQYYYEAAESMFIPVQIDDVTINLVTQLVDKGYGLTAAQVTAAADNDALNTLFINARIAKYRAEASTCWDIDDAIFMANWVEFFAGTDNRAKNTYPYTFGTETSKWKWRIDDTDTVMPTDNEGKIEKEYYVEVHDLYPNGNNVWNGETSNFWNLLELAFPTEMATGMTKMLTAMESLGGLTSGTDYDKLYAFYTKYYLGIKAYFPHNIVNADAKRYEMAKIAYNAGTYVNDTDPITQSLGDSFSTETAWMKKRIIYMMSKYSFGYFGENGTDSINVRASGNAIQYDLTPAIAMYPTIINGTSVVRGARTMAGIVCPILVSLSGTGDQQNIIQGASYLEDIGTWYDKQVSGSMIISGKMLKVINLGHDTAAIVISITALTLSNCVSLQTLILTRIATLTGTLDLTACSHIRFIYAEGTALTQIKLPTGGGLERIVYPGTNQYIKLENFPLLTADNIDISNCLAVITDLFIVDCEALNPITILQAIVTGQSSQTAHVLKRIRLVGILASYTTNGSAILDLLATLVNGTYVGLDSLGIAGSDTYPVLSGTLSITANVYEDSFTTLKSYYPKLVINLTGNYYVRFVDPNVLAIVLAHWGDGTGITSDQVKAINDDGGYFNGNTDIISFDEFQYFTGLTTWGLNSTAWNRFSGCTSLKNIILPSTITAIGGTCFNGCTSLIFIKIPSSVVYIYRYAFRGCTSLTTVTFLAGSLFNLPVGNEEGTFTGCSKLTSINLEICTHLNHISGAMFQYCTLLQSIKIPIAVTSIGGYAFEYCTALTTVTFLGSLITSIGLKAFHECTALTTVTFNGVTSMTIGDQAFNDCPLTSIDLTGVTSIGGSAFAGCNNLLHVVIPGTVTYLGGGSFHYCSSLLTIVVQEGVTAIPTSLCDNNPSLLTIDFPSTITSIGDSLLFKTNLTTWIIRATTPPTLAGTSSYGVNSSFKIYVPDASVAAYKAATNWSTWASHIVALSTLPA